MISGLRLFFFNIYDYEISENFFQPTAFLFSH